MADIWSFFVLFMQIICSGMFLWSYLWKGDLLDTSFYGIFWLVYTGA